MKPILCNYYVTYRCNSRCRFCEIWREKKYQQHPDAELSTVLENLVALRQIGIRFVDFTGGEPLLYSHLATVLQFARKLGLKTSVTTNGLLYEKFARELKGLVTYLHFSLDSLSESEHNEIRGVPSFRQVMQNIALAQSLGERPDILFTVTETNYQETPRLQKFCAEKRMILIVNPVFGYGQQRDLEISRLDYLDQFRALPYVYVNRAFHYLRRKGGNQIRHPRCRAMTSTIVISPDNHLLAPCFHYQTRAFKITGNLGEILKSAAYQQVKKKEGAFDFCQGCAVNCYLDPSFFYRLDWYFVLSLISKAKYIFDKQGRTWLRRKE
jgi:MoaA/NifB/PqqE/SkfB family radical SAM enzyme